MSDLDDGVKRYLVHSRNIEVDGTKLVGENVSEDNLDLATVLGQLTKTVGSVHWNIQGLNDMTADERIYPKDSDMTIFDEQIQNLQDKINEFKDSFLKTKTELDKVLTINYLDNTDFMNPINQRGEKTYQVTSEAGTYGIDRWFVQKNSTLTINQIGISVDGIITQYIEYPTTENTWTFIAQSATDDSYKKVVYANGEVSGDTDVLNIRKIKPFDDSPQQYLAMDLKTGSWLNAGLFAGDKALVEKNDNEETIYKYKYIAKGYNYEFNQCAKYFYRYIGDSPIAGARPMENNERLIAYGYIPVQMRINPTVIIKSISNIAIGDCWVGLYAPLTETQSVGGDPEPIPDFNTYYADHPELFKFHENLCDYIAILGNQNAVNLILDEDNNNINQQTFKSFQNIGLVAIALSCVVPNLVVKEEEIEGVSTPIPFALFTKASGGLKINSSSKYTILSTNNWGGSIAKNVFGSCRLAIDFDADLRLE